MSSTASGRPRPPRHAANSSAWTRPRRVTVTFRANHDLIHLSIADAPVKTVRSHLPANGRGWTGLWLDDWARDGVSRVAVSAGTGESAARGWTSAHRWRRWWPVWRGRRRAPWQGRAVCLFDVPMQASACPTARTATAASASPWVRKSRWCRSTPRPRWGWRRTDPGSASLGGLAGRLMAALPAAGCPAGARVAHPRRPGWRAESRRQPDLGRLGEALPDPRDVDHQAGFRRDCTGKGEQK